MALPRSPSCCDVDVMECDGGYVEATNSRLKRKLRRTSSVSDLNYNTPSSQQTQHTHTIAYIPIAATGNLNPLNRQALTAYLGRLAPGQIREAAAPKHTRALHRHSHATQKKDKMAHQTDMEEARTKIEETRWNVPAYQHDCGERETVAHLFLSCSALSTHREALARAFKQLGLPSATVDDILHPVGSAHRVRPACARSSTTSKPRNWPTVFSEPRRPSPQQTELPDVFNSPRPPPPL
ncbi:hypothetical protein HPB52_021848 [Rhipicephalus sanguineus]|uniref:Tick transposon n=1 Tax=Rhipicephalus sanguineus TaxID=34632 RepID=A0A9D4PHY9_RHISA|nr:hypothetical protein HPB52_021848 [Rhipicephalus sanguineus]